MKYQSQQFNKIQLNLQTLHLLTISLEMVY